MTRYVATVEDRAFTIEVREGEVIVDGQAHAVDMRRIEPLSLYSLLIDNLSYEALVEERQGEHAVMLRGELYTVRVREERAWQAAAPCSPSADGGGEVRVEAPMPGVVREVLVNPGQEVRARETLLILESMKMENNLSCPQEGVVRAVLVTAGDHVERGQVLVIVSELGGPGADRRGVAG